MQTNLVGANKTYTSIFGIAAIVFIITAIFSIGYYHADEHYQIIEFAGVKLGTNGFLDMAWEYKKALRSSFQPTIAFVILSVLKEINIGDPYIQLIVLRLISALATFLAIRYFVNKTIHLFKSENIKKFYIFCSYFLWFIPFLAVRFSSETWSTIFYLPVIGLLLNKKFNSSSYYFIGILAGLSFLCRYQLALFFLVTLIWLVSVNKSSMRSIFKSILGFLIILAIGIGVDYWFYEELTFPFVNYFKAAFFETDSPNFDSVNWSFYLENLFSAPTSFIGLIITLSLLIFAFTKPKNIVVWLVVTFILIHSFIPHKEIRFLFPLAFLFPYIITEAFSFLNKKFKPKKSIKYVGISVGAIFFMINTLGLVVMGTKPAGTGGIAISKYVHQFAENENVQFIYCNWSSPYDPWDGLPSKFYSEENIELLRINNPCELSSVNLNTEKKVFFVARNADLNNPECIENLNNLNFKFIKKSISPWILDLNEIYGGFDNQVVLNLYEYKN